MKLLISLMLLASTSAFAQATYDLSNQTACVLQVIKQEPASLVVACGSETYQHEKIQPYSQMQNAKAFQAQAKESFLSHLGDRSTLKCLEYDNQWSLVFICTRP